MSITIEKTTDQESWNDYVERSPNGTAFHQYEALETQAAHSSTTLHALVGYKGQEPVGLFPVFEFQKGPIPFVFSPPFGLRVQYLGPALLNMAKLKQRKREQRHRAFVEGCLEWIDYEIGPRYMTTRTDWRYGDLRPYKWSGFEVQPSYTYVVDLEPDESDVMSRFSRTTRRRIRNHSDDRYVVEEGGTEAIEWIIRQVNERYEEQGESTPITADFVTDLFERLPDGQVKPYVLSVDGERITGTVLLEYDGTAHRWQGGVKVDHELPANELLEWHMMREAGENGIEDYEIVDANFPRLNEWKAKFGPTVRPYYSLKRTSVGVDAAVRIYQRVQERSALL